VKFQNYGRPRKRPTPFRLTPQQTAAAHEEAIEWRDAWRAEQAARRSNGAPIEPVASPVLHKDDKQADNEAEKRAEKLAKEQAARFAAALARVEFGRFFWNDQLAGQVAKSLDKARRAKIRESS
jgi:hypothetical protein